MAVVENLENAGVELGKTVGSASANRNPEAAAAEQTSETSNDQDQSSSAKHGPLRQRLEAAMQQKQQYAMANGNGNGNGNSQNGQLSYDQVVHHQQRSNGEMNGGDHHDAGDSFNRDMRELRELFSKLNPMAEEFVPPSHANNNNHGINGGFVDFTALMMQNGNRMGQINGGGFPGRRVCT